MSSLGFPDFQQIQQWFGDALAQATARAVGAGSFTDGPFLLSSWSSVIVWVKPAGGPVVVTVTQQIDGAAPALAVVNTFTATAGQVVAESFVLLGNSISIKVQGSVAGTTVDYAIIPSNTTLSTTLSTVTAINGITGRATTGPGALAQQGTGFTVTPGAAGIVTINFAVPFVSPPIFVATPLGFQGIVWDNGPAVGSVVVNTATLAGVLTDATFEFIAIEAQ